MTTIQLTVWNGTPLRRGVTVEASSRGDVERHAADLLAEYLPDNPRAFVTHSIVSGRAFPGYRKMPREFYGPAMARTLSELQQVWTVDQRLAMGS